jgi:hypothetical protein
MMGGDELIRSFFFFLKILCINVIDIQCNDFHLFDLYTYILSSYLFLTIHRSSLNPSLPLLLLSDITSMSTPITHVSNHIKSSLSNPLFFSFPLFLKKQLNAFHHIPFSKSLKQRT